MRVSALWPVLGLCALVTAAHAQPDDDYAGLGLAAEVLWAVETGPGGGDRYAKLVPLLDGDRVCAADRSGRVACYLTGNGRKLWVQDLNTTLSGGLSAANGRLYLGSQEAEVYALDRNDGTLVWHVPVSSEVLAPPKPGDAMIVVQTNDGKLFGLRQGNGERVWVYDRTVPALSLRGTSVPLIYGSSVIAGFPSGRLAAVSLRDGALLWEAAVAVPKGRSELERMVDIDSEPQLADGTVYTVSFQGRAAAFDADSGRTVWARDMSSYQGLSVGGAHLYIVDAGGNVWALDRASGATVWMQSRLKGRASTAPVVAGDNLVVGGSDGALYWLSRDDGRLISRLPAEDVVRNVMASYTARTGLGEDDALDLLMRESPIVASAPLVDGDVLYVPYTTGVLAAVRAPR